MSLLNFHFLPLVTIILTSICGCTIYKSEGRKTFETQSPSQIRTLSLIECSDSASPLTQGPEQVEYTTNGHKIGIHFYENKVYAQVSFVNTQPQQSCTYLANNPEHWENIKEQFYSEIDAILDESLQ